MSEWTNLQGQIEYKPLDDGIHVGRSVIFDVIAISGIKFSIAVGFASIGLAIDYPPVQFFIIATGGILSIILGLALLSEWGKQDALFDMHIQKHKPEEPKVKGTTEIHNHFNTAGGVKTTISQYDTDKLPPQKFIEWLFHSAGSDGRIPSERAIRESEWSQSAFNDWLDTMDKESITVKIDSRPNAARRVQGMLEDALRHFGYDLSPTLAPDITRK